MPARPLTALALSMLLALHLPAQQPVRVKSTNSPVWGANVKLTQNFSLGAIGGDPETEFSSIEKIAVDRKGNMYVYDGREITLRMFDATGKFVRRIGRKGSGPGEFESIGGMGIVQDSVLVLLDPRNTRLTFFGPDGKMIKSVRELRANNGGDQSNFGIDKSGLIYISVSRAGKEGEESFVHEGGVSNSIYLRLKPDGSRLDSLPFPPMMATTRNMFYLMTADGGTSNFIPETWFAPHTGGGVVYGNGDSLRFVVKPPTGPMRIIERAYKPVAITGEERAQWDAYAKYMQNRDKGNTATYSIPNFKPAFRSIYSDRDARIWVSVYAVAEKIVRPPRPAGDLRPLLTMNQHATYEVFDQLGTYLGRVELPHRSQLMEAQGNRIWVLGKGKEEEDVVTGYTVSGVTTAADRPATTPVGRGGGGG